MSHPEEEPLEHLDEEDDGNDRHCHSPHQSWVGDSCRHDTRGTPRGGLDTIRARRPTGAFHSWATVADAAAEISDARRRPWGTLVGMLNVRLLLRSRGEA